MEPFPGVNDDNHPTDTSAEQVNCYVVFCFVEKCAEMRVLLQKHCENEVGKFLKPFRAYSEVRCAACCILMYPMQCMMGICGFGLAESAGPVLVVWGDER